MDLLQALFRNIVEIALPLTAVIALLLLLRPLLKKHYPARWMYWVWLLIAVRLLVPVNFSLPRAPITVADTGVAVYRHDTIRTNPGFSDYVLLTPEGRGQAVAEEKAAVAAGAEHTGGDIQDQYHPVLTLKQIAALVWVAGACVLLVWEAVSYMRFRRRVRRWRSEEEDEAVRAHFDALCAELGVNGLTIARCSAVSSPMVTGFLHPALLLPGGPFPPEALDAALRHELVHHSRHDLWYKLLLLAVRVIYWFDPLVWLMERQGALDLEISCDEAVVDGRDERFRAAYSRAILASAESGLKRDHAPLTTYFHGGKKAMKERLKSILNSGAKRRGLVALAVAAALVVTASAVCSVGAGATQVVDGHAYTLNVPASMTVKLTEVMPEAGFTTSYYQADFYRDGGVGSVRLHYVPGFGDMTLEERVAALQPGDHLETSAYTSPGGLEGFVAKNSPVERYYLFMGENQVLELYFYLGPKFDDFFEGRFSRAEIDAALASIIIGYNRSSNQDLGLTFTTMLRDNGTTVWYLWDTSGSPVALSSTSSAGSFAASPIWSPDGKWATIPTSGTPNSEGFVDYRQGFHILSIDKTGISWNYNTLFDMMHEEYPGSLFTSTGFALNYTPVPSSLELTVLSFVENPFPNAPDPAVKLFYAWQDTEGRIQSGTAVYLCEPLERNYSPYGGKYLTQVEQNAPLVNYAWEDGAHTLSMHLPEGSSATGSVGDWTLRDALGTELGRVFKVKQADGYVTAVDAGRNTALYQWPDETNGDYYQLELSLDAVPAQLTSWISSTISLDGASVSFGAELGSQGSESATQGWQQIKGRLYMNDWQIDYRVEVPEGVNKEPSGFQANLHPYGSIALLPSDEVPADAAARADGILIRDDLTQDGRPVDREIFPDPAASGIRLSTAWYLPLDDPDFYLRFLWEDGHDLIASQVLASIQYENLMATPHPDLPLPTAEQMGLTGDAAAIFDALERQYADPEQVPYRSQPNDVMFPRFTPYGSYENGGKTAFVGSLNRTWYYSLQPNGAGMGQGGGGNPACILGTYGEDGVFRVEEIIDSGDGEGYAASIRKLCGPLTGLADAFLQGGDLPAPLWTMPLTAQEMVDIYLADLPPA